MAGRAAPIVVEQLHVVRGGNPVLPDLSLAVGSGRVTGLLGPSGAGKTTLIRAIVGVQRIQSGEVRVLGEPAVGLDPVLRRALWATFHALAGEGSTLLISSHVMDEAEHCDQLVLLREGRVLAAESPDELLRRTGASSLGDAFLRLIEGE